METFNIGNNYGFNMEHQITIKLENKSNLQAVVNALKTISDEVTLNMNETGITFRGMDPSHVVMVDVAWASSTFTEYTRNQDTKISIIIKEINDILKRAKNENIQIDIDTEKKLKLSIGDTLKYNLRTLESSDTDTPLPKIDYDCKFKFNMSKIINVIDDIKVISDMFNIKLSDDERVFEGKGDSGEASIVYDLDDGETLDVKDTCQSSYSIEYLQPIISALKGNCEFIIGELSTNKPIKMTFDMSDKGGSVITVFLAPRVEN